MRKRTASISRHLMAGCYVCHGEDNPQWTDKNAQGVAVRHHDKTGHRVWVIIEAVIKYGEQDAPKPL